MKYELYYSTGGHAGPYVTKALAVVAAKRLIVGIRNSMDVEIRPYNSPEPGGYGEGHKKSTYVRAKKG